MQLRFIIVTVLYCTSLLTRAQNTSPYWSLAGNSNATNSSRLGTTNATALNLTTNNLTRLKLFSDGRVGVGGMITNNNATRALNIADENGVLRIIRVHTTYAPAVELLSRTTANGPNIAYWDMYAEPTDSSFRIRDRIGGGAGLDRITVKNNGYVGIGITKPHSALHVSDATAVKTFSAINTYREEVDRVGIYGESINSPSNGTGVHGVGGYRGIFGEGSESGVEGLGRVGVAGSGDTGPFSGGLGVFGNGYTGILGVSSEPGGTAVYAVGSGGAEGLHTYSFNSYSIYADIGDPTASYAGYFNGNIYVNGTYGGSDRMLKQNITDIGSALEVINQLQPKRYEYRQDGNFQLMNLPKGSHFGLIAQDVELLLPSLVKETSFSPVAIKNSRQIMADSTKALAGKHERFTLPMLLKDQAAEIIRFKAVNYTEFTPLLIKAVQELSQENEALKRKVEKLNTLEARLEKLEALLKTNAGSVNLTTAFLEQNAPNPARGLTTFRFHVPENAVSVRFTVTNAKGQLLKTINITGRGMGRIDFNTQTLSSGTYTCSLVVDGSPVDTKQLLIAR